MKSLLSDRSLLYVTGKGGVGKTTVAAALGLAAARLGRRTIVCEVAEQDRMSRAFARHGVRPEMEVELAQDLWAITVDPQRALELYDWALSCFRALGDQQGIAVALRGLGSATNSRSAFAAAISATTSGSSAGVQ